MKKINYNFNRISLILFICILINFNLYSIDCSTTKAKTESHTHTQTQTSTLNKNKSQNKNNNSIGYRFHNNNSFHSKIGAGIGLNSFYKLGKTSKSKTKKNLKMNHSPITKFFDLQPTQKEKEATKIAKRFFSKQNKEDREPVDYNQINQFKNDIKVTKEGWARINSDYYSDFVNNPEIQMRNNKIERIQLDEQKFRVNEFYTKKKYGDKNYPPSRSDFYFRLSGRNLYYSSFKNSLKVLDNMSFNEITSVVLNTSNPDLSMCLKITTNFEKIWNMCINDSKIRMEWLCQLNKQLGNDPSECHKIVVDAINAEPIVQETKIMDPVILIPLPSKNCNEDWNYESHGTDWECECSDGKEQSPIDLPPLGVPGGAVKSKVLPIFRYKEVDLKEEGSKIEYKENMVQLNNNDFGEVVTLDGIVYKAQKIQFKTPAEHTINGKSFAMEMQIVHFSEMKGSMHKKLVLNIIFDIYPGIFNKFIEDLDFFNLPNQSQPEHELNSKILIDKIFYDTEKEEYINIQNLDYYTYQGSLTNPPCDQQTINIVNASPILVGSTTVRLFQEALKIPDMVDTQGNIIVGNSKSIENNRKTQPLNGRKVYYYESLKPMDSVVVRKVEKTNLPGGHYEKYTKNYTSYYYVNNDKPSNMPGAFLASKAEALGKNVRT